MAEHEEIEDNAERWLSMEDALRDSEGRWRGLVSVLPVGISILDREHRIVYFNPALGEILEITKAGLRAGAYKSRTYFNADGSPMSHQQFPSTRAVVEQRTIQAVVGIGMEDGKRIWTEVSAAPLDLPDYSCVVVTSDITERVQMQEALRSSELKHKALSAQLEAIIDHLPGLVFYKDRHNNFIRVNRVVAQGYRKDKAEMEGKSLYELYPQEEAERYYMNDLEVINSGNAKMNFEEQWRTADGIRWLSTSKIPFVDETGQIIGVIGISLDITERKRSDQLIQELIHRLEKEKDFAQKSAMTDGLTLIANRRHFDEALNVEFSRTKRAGTHFSLIMLDIDYFKKFNDLYGHPAGDECLQRVAAVLASSIGRVPDFVARYGGEEFVAILPDTEASGAAIVAERIRKSVEGLAITHADSDISSSVTISLGVATIDPACVPTSAKALELVDAALYRAKKRGRNRFEFATEGQDGSMHEVSDGFIRLVWHSKYGCGNDPIDEQHRGLFDAANSILSAMEGNVAKNECRTLMEALMEKMLDHFGTEELLLDSVAYPLIKAHRTCHADLIAKALVMAKKFDRDMLSFGDLFEFLAHEVISQHILKEDKKYFQYVSDR